MRDCPYCDASVEAHKKDAAEIALLRAGVEVMRGMLQECRNAIAHLDPMALGGQHANHPEQEWYFRDELLSRLDSVLIDEPKTTATVTAEDRDYGNS